MRILGEKISYQYQKNHWALKDISLDIAQGEKVAIIGPNGAGKSTLLSIINGELQPHQGNINIKLADGSEIPPVLKGYVPQNIALFEHLSIFDNLHYFGTMYGVEKHELKERIEQLCQDLLPEKSSSTKVKQLSGGMKRRVNLMCALIHHPHLVILDEPTVGVDIVSKDKIVAFIKSYQAKHNAILIYTSHLMIETTEICDKVIFIDKGVIIDKGFIPDLLNKYNKSNLKEVFVEIMFK